MLKEYAALIQRMMFVIDLAIVAGSFFLAYTIRNSADGLYPLDAYTWPLFFLLLIWGMCLYHSGIYASFRLKTASEVIFSIYQSSYLGFFLFAGLCYFLRYSHVSRVLVLLTVIFSAVFLAVEKVVIVLIMRHLRRHGINYRNVIVVGTGQRAQRLIKALDCNRDLGMRIVGLVDMDPAKTGEVVCGHAVVGTLNDLPKVTREKVVDQVFFVVPRSWLDKIEKAIVYLETLGVRVDLATDYFNLGLARSRQSDLFGVPFLTFETTPAEALPLLVKRSMDIVLSGIALVVLSPVFAVTAILIKMTSEGPVFFVQKRVSLNGRIFNLFKFRTMVKDAEAQLAELQYLNEMKGPVFKIEKDPRITAVGAFLRKTSIDELPQFWNVFRGDMSLVGPRPPLPLEVEQYDDWQRRRLSLRPGITCLWQIGGRNRITSFEEWARLDLLYIDNWSLWLDLRILAKTVPVVLFHVGAK